VRAIFQMTRLGPSRFRSVGCGGHLRSDPSCLNGTTGELYERATMEGEARRRGLSPILWPFETFRFGGEAYGSLEFCDNPKVRRDPGIVAVRRSVSRRVGPLARWFVARGACAK